MGDAFTQFARAAVAGDHGEGMFEENLEVGLAHAVEVGARAAVEVNVENEFNLIIE